MKIEADILVHPFSVSAGLRTIEIDLDDIERVEQVAVRGVTRYWTFFKGGPPSFIFVEDPRTLAGDEDSTE